MTGYVDLGMLFGLLLFSFGIFAIIVGSALVEASRFRRFLTESKQLDRYAQWREQYNKKKWEVRFGKV
jgi:hypothetical protein